MWKESNQKLPTEQVSTVTTGRKANTLQRQIFAAYTQDYKCFIQTFVRRFGKLHHHFFARAHPDTRTEQLCCK